jgi:hypothetical protein
MPRDQQRAVAALFATMTEERPFIEPDLASPGGRPGDRALAARIAALIHRGIGLRQSPRRYAGWLGVECSSVRSAVWMMRALVASNVLSRREDEVLFVPVNAATDPGGALVSSAVAHVYRCASARGIVP